MESQPQNPEFKNNLENFHSCRPIFMEELKLVQCLLSGIQIC